MYCRPHCSMLSNISEASLEIFILIWHCREQKKWNRIGNTMRPKQALSRHENISCIDIDSLPIPLGLIPQWVERRSRNPKMHSSNPARDNEFFAVLCSVRLKWICFAYNIVQHCYTSFKLNYFVDNYEQCTQQKYDIQCFFPMIKDFILLKFTTRKSFNDQIQKPFPRVKKNSNTLSKFLVGGNRSTRKKPTTFSGALTNSARKCHEPK